MGTVKRDKLITCRVSAEMMKKIEAEAARQHRSIAGLLYLHLIEIYGDQELHEQGL